jgi:putative FmdB family regulatory protein
MPIYEFRCTTCGTRYETLVARAERALRRCPRCGSKAERLISTFAVGKAGAAATPPGPCGSSDCACRARDR